MATGKQIATQVIQTYKSVKIVRNATRLKLDRLKESNTLYAVFENPPVHPYTTFVANGVDLVEKFEYFVSALLDKKMLSGTLRSEFEKVKIIQLKTGLDSSDVDALLQLPITIDENCTLNKIGEQLFLVFEKQSVLLIQSDVKWAKEALSNVISRKNINSHIEVPFQRTASCCRSAIKEAKKLAKMVLDEVIDASTIRNELAQIQTMRILKGLGDSDALRKLVVLV